MILNNSSFRVFSVSFILSRNFFRLFFLPNIDSVRVGDMADIPKLELPEIIGVVAITRPKSSLLFLLVLMGRLWQLLLYLGLFLMFQHDGYLLLEQPVEVSFMAR